MSRDKRNRKEVKCIEITGCKNQVKNIAHTTILTWRISNYESLHCNVMYFQFDKRESIGCVFRLFKFDKTLHLSVSGADVLQNTPAEFSIVSETSYELITEQAVKIASSKKDGVFVGKFPEERFLNESNFLTDGILTVAFKYEADDYTSSKNSCLTEPDIFTNSEEVCYDLKRMYLDSLFPDFNVHVKEHAFKCHKMILTARSKYFFDILEFDKKKVDHTLPDDTMPAILHHVLLYIYCGEILEWDEDFMMQVYKLAVYLKVNALCRRCLEYFEKELHEDNYMTFFEFAAKFQLIELKNMIIRISLVEFKHLDIISVFKDIEQQSKEKSDSLEDK